MSSNWLTYVKLSDTYERKARFLPAVLSILFLFPLAHLLRVPFSSWLNALLAGTGISAVLSVGLSHIASAFGNRYQKKLWPRWPHDSPTNQWLHPDDTTRSGQQKRQWYGAIKRLTKLDIESTAASGNSTELEALINDAVAQLRNQLWQPDYAERLRIHNADYGFARNLTGMRPVWLTFALVSSCVSWIIFFVSERDLLWPVTTTALTIIAFILGFVVLPDYVRRKAYHYAASIFTAVLALDADHAVGS